MRPDSRTIHHAALTLLVLLWLSACASRPPVDRSGPADAVPTPQQISRLPGDPPMFALSSLAAALGTMERYETSHGVALLQLLEDLPSGFLNRIPDTPDAAGSFQHWPQLAVTIRETLVQDADLGLAARAWAAEHPGHAVTEPGFIDLAEAYRGLFALPTRIGVLLPNEGGLASAGKAIRDGLLSSYLQQPRGVQLRFYPTTEDPQSAVAAYFSALNDGAQWIIGPLRRESVEALSGLGSLGVPLLLLNDPVNVERQFTESLVFSLSLAQEMEARAIADQALENGLKSALVLAADSPWGQRIETAFSEAFLEGGGDIRASARFNPAETDHGELLTRLLQLDQSQGRKDRLQATLNIPLSFEPTRRDDFDLIFLAASPVQGRQIRPQLRYYDAFGKPVFATARIYSGEVNRDQDLDLNGIIFPSTRWHLSGSLDGPRLSSVHDGSMGSLFDLGADAWRMLPWLPLLRKDPDLRFTGRLGTLFMDARGRVRRQPLWAVFSGGAPVPAVFGSAPESSRK